MARRYLEVTQLPFWALAPDQLARHIPAVVVGNFDTDTPFKLWAQRASRVVAVSSPFIVNRLHTLDGLLDNQPGLAVIQFALFSLHVWTVISVGVRSRDKDRTALLSATLKKQRDNGATALGTFLHGCSRLFVLFLVTLIVVARAALFVMHPDVGLWWGLVSLLPFSILFVGSFDVIWTTDLWVDGSRRAIRGFGKDVAELFGVSTRRGRTLIRRVSVFNTREGLPDPEGAAEIGEVKNGSARARFENAFDEARDVVETMNEILSGPITVMLAILLASVIHGALLVGTRPKEEAAMFTVATIFLSVLLVMTLKWLSSVGDVYDQVTREVLSPGIFLRLSVELERETPNLAELARGSLRDASLGFSVYNVTMTTRKVIYILGTLIFSMLVSQAA